MPSRAASDQLCDELDDLGVAKDRYHRTVYLAIRDGVVTEEERRRIATDRAAMKARFRVVNRRAERMASGNRMLRLLANTGEITPKAERLFRELVADESRIVAFPTCDDDGPDDSGAALKVAA